MIPYGLVYTRKYTQTIVPDAEFGDRLLRYAAARFGQGYLDLPFFFAQLGEFLIQGRRYWLGAAAIILLVPFYRRSRLVRFYFGLLAGWLTVTLFIPFVDLTIATRLHTLPFQLDLIRNVKWMDAFGLTAVALLLGEWRRSWPEPQHERSAQSLTSRLRMHAAPVMAMLAVVSCYGHLLCDLHAMTAMDLGQLSALQGRHARVTQFTMEVINAVHALRRDGERVFGPLPFRQMYIPLSFVQKDTGALGYSNPNGLVRAV
jgi:hypothetical protein